MRHGKTHNHLGRKTGHRKLLLRNLAKSLIVHKRISTTLAKAKALRVFVEPIITSAKANDQHAHREAFRMLQDKMVVKELFAGVVPVVGDRPGGYVRVIRTGTRLGDNAETALIELVDFNESYNLKESKKSGGRRRRRRSSGSSAAGAPTATGVAAAAKEVAAEAQAVAEEEIPQVTMTEETLQVQEITPEGDAEASGVAEVDSADENPSQEESTNEEQKEA